MALTKINHDTITLGAGCFWCVEAIFESLIGVESVTSGYMGGESINPTYKEVCTGKTGHAEVCRIIYNPEAISIEEILEVFWKTHDPTTLNRQGNDIGTQYRSAIFFNNIHQKNIAIEYKKKLDETKIWDSPIVTEITEASEFYPAEDYHQEYYQRNKEQSYCNLVITPKLEKFKKVFNQKLK